MGGEVYERVGRDGGSVNALAGVNHREAKTEKEVTIKRLRVENFGRKESTWLTSFDRTILLTVTILQHRPRESASICPAEGGRSVVDRVKADE